ncbi:hypothetical protein C3L33_17786, partial [Rhododendron williamsianum]
MEVESPSNLPLPDAFLDFLNENGLDPSVYTNSDPTPRYVRYIHVFEKLKLLYQSQLVTSCCSIGLPGAFQALPKIACLLELQFGYPHDFSYCAKLCMILDLLGSSGSVTGIDVARHRLAACRTMETVERQKKAAKARVTVASQLASSTQDPELIYYGKNSGVVGLTRSEIYQTFRGNDVLRCGYDKLQLLTNGFRLLKIGGSLVYSTCSLTVAQNEDVVEQFLLQNLLLKWIFICAFSLICIFECLYLLAELLEIDAAKNWPCRSGRIPKTLRFDPMTSRTSGLFVAKFTKLAI